MSDCKVSGIKYTRKEGVTVLSKCDEPGIITLCMFTVSQSFIY